MKNQKPHSVFFIVMLFFSFISSAQTIDIAEENNLKFQTHFFEALKQKAIKNYSKAIESLEKCYEIDSLNTSVEFEFSKNYLLLENYFEATFFINKTLIKEPKNRHILKHKVAILESQRNFKEAIKTQLKIVEINPKSSDKLVLLYIQNREFKKAEQLIVKIEKNALSTQRIKGFKIYLENRKKTGITITTKEVLITENLAIETLKEKYKQTKEYKILTTILNKEVENKLFRSLYNDSKEALEIFPAQPFLYKMNGLASNKLGKYNEAINVLTLGIDFVIDNTTLEAEFYEQLSNSYLGLAQPKEALKYKQKAEELKKQH